ncbi:MAG: guanylate kinase [Bacteroidota bacterium]
MTQDKKLIIFTAPSGAGKTTIVHHLLNTFPHKLSFSVSAATRQARDNEKNGIDYYFMSVEEFKEKIMNNEFVEWEMVYEGKYYGTLKSDLERIWEMGKTPVLDIDVQGAIHVQQQFADITLSIFVVPPSVDALKERLQSRGTETDKSLQTRINKANYEMSFKREFSKELINDNLEKACAEAERLVKAFLHF